MFSNNYDEWEGPAPSETPSKKEVGPVLTCNVIDDQDKKNENKKLEADVRLLSVMEFDDSCLTGNIL